MLNRSRLATIRTIKELGGAMGATHTSYDFNESVTRITEILDSSDASYEDRDAIPPRSRLTFTNGFYIPVSVLLWTYEAPQASLEVTTVRF
jgi:hypothetical protein